MNKYNLIPILVLLALTTLAHGASLRLPSMFTDHMVLQQGRALPVWGQAAPGATVNVQLNGQQATTTAGMDGRWTVRLKPCLAGGPYALTVTAGAETVTVQDVLVGEVWVCSGQSNMDMAVGSANNAREEIAAAQYPQIRFFTVEHVVANTPQQFVKGSWSVCSPQTVAGAYAAGYFFGRELHKKLNVPVGLIQAGWSGSPAEAWTPQETLEANPYLRPILQYKFDDQQLYDTARKAFDAQMPVWMAKMQPLDTGITDEAKGWSKPDADLRRWGSMPVPAMFMHSEPGLYLWGAFWFRRTVEIPADWTGHALKLDLGPIADFDATFFNDVQVGATVTDAPETAKISRSYQIPANLVHAGNNVIAVRMFTRYNEPGFVAKAEAMQLLPADLPQAQPLPLAGAWRYRVERGVPMKSLPHSPIPPNSNWAPTKLFNGMIHPLLPYAIRGVAWYQGEHNAEHAFQYRQLFPTMITAWRKAWGQGDFPFVYVQIANWLHRQEEPSDNTWAELREAQRMALSVPNTGMAVAIDIGDALDIHPKNKQEVGRRLALAAEKIAYGMNIPYSGPIYRAMKVEKQRIRLRFDHTDGGLQVHGDELAAFAIAGADHRFVRANAKIDGNTVLVWSDDVPNPVAVRYGWHYNPPCNLYNGAGLPASPFRTDDWQELSEQ